MARTKTALACPEPPRHTCGYLIDGQRPCVRRAGHTERSRHESAAAREKRRARERTEAANAKARERYHRKWHPDG